MKIYTLSELKYELQDGGEYVPADTAQALYDALTTIINAGQWYGSALEIDMYRDGAIEGEELERMGREALATADGEAL